MSRRWVFDASPLIVLAKIDQSDLLEKLCDTPVIPEAVAEEIQHGPASDPGRQWLATQAEDWIRKTSLLPQTARRDLGRGERADCRMPYITIAPPSWMNAQPAAMLARVP